MRSRNTVKTALVLALALPFAAFAQTQAPALVGPGVGNADVFLSEGNRLYNAKEYEAAAAQFLQATRADPSLLAAYLGLARSRFGLRDVGPACYAYRQFVRNTQDAQERTRAEGELELCERQRAALPQPPADPTPTYVEQKAQFFSALDRKKLVGEGSAHEALGALVSGGYLAPDLGEMAQKLHAAVTGEVDALHTRALSKEKPPAEELRRADELAAVASQVGTPVSKAEAKVPFLMGMGELQAQGGDVARAEALLAEAVRADGTQPEYKFVRALALHRAGDSRAALRTLEQDLPDDPRTGVLRAALAVGDSPEAGARELERLLFEKRF